MQIGWRTWVSCSCIFKCVFVNMWCAYIHEYMICMLACTFISIDICIYIYTHTNVYTCMYIYFVYVTVFTSTHTRTRTRTYVYIYVCVCVCVYICVQACVFKWKNKSAWDWARETECAGEVRQQQIIEIMPERGSERENMSTWQHSWTDAIETIEYFFYQMTFFFFVVVTVCVEVLCLLFACWLFQSAKCMLYAMTLSCIRHDSFTCES